MNKEILEQPKNLQVQDNQGEVVSQLNDGAECEPLKDNGSKLGKFCDSEALLKAYNNLQVDYTKKCQLLSQLQKEIKAKEEVANSSPLIDVANNNQKIESYQDKDKLPLEKILNASDFLTNFVFENQELKEKIVKEYFSKLNFDVAPRLISNDKGSRMILNPVHKPKSFEDAGKFIH